MKNLIIVNIDNIIFFSFQKKTQQKEEFLDYPKALKNKSFLEFLSLTCDATIILDLRSVLSELNKNSDIIYLTVCPPKALPYINHFLNVNGFMGAGEKIHIIFNKSGVAHNSQLYEKKKNVLSHLSNGRQTVLMFGADTTDAAAAYINKIPSVIYAPVKEETFIAGIAELTHEDEIDEYSVAVVKEWSDICLYAKHCLGLTECVNEICSKHASNYADWLSDLDQKSYLILVVATFCSTTFLNILIQANPSNRLLVVILSIVGLIASLLSMYFAITSFASRVTHGAEVIFDLLFPVLMHKKHRHYAAPVEDKARIDTSSFGVSAGAKYLLKRYKTLNKNEIVTKNMMNLRASNYTKIFPEYFARVLLVFSIIIMFLIGGISCFSYFIHPTAVTGTFRANYSIKSVSKDKIDDNRIYIFYPGDFDQTLSQLSTQGQCKIDTILDQMTDAQNLAFVSLDPTSFFLSDDTISDYKRNIYLAILSDALLKHGKEMEIVLIDG